MRHIPPKKISAWLDSEMTGPAAAQVERHLAECAECRSLQDEMLALNQLFRTPAPAEPPARIWNGVASELGTPQEVRHRWLSGSGVIAERFSWAREQMWAAAAILLVMCCVTVFYWSSENAKRQQLAQIDRICETLLPPDVKSYNPFTESPLNHTAINPFTLGRQDVAVVPADKPGVKR